MLVCAWRMIIGVFVDMRGGKRGTCRKEASDWSQWERLLLGGRRGTENNHLENKCYMKSELGQKNLER